MNLGSTSPVAGEAVCRGPAPANRAPIVSRGSEKNAALYLLTPQPQERRPRVRNPREGEKCGVTHSPSPLPAIPTHTEKHTFLLETT